MYGGSLEAGTAVEMRPKMRIATPMMASEIHPVLNRVLARLVIDPLEARSCPALPTPPSMPQNEAHRLSKEGLFTRVRGRGVPRSSGVLIRGRWSIVTFGACEGEKPYGNIREPRRARHILLWEG